MSTGAEPGADSLNGAAVSLIAEVEATRRAKIAKTFIFIFILLINFINLRFVN